MYDFLCRKRNDTDVSQDPQLKNRYQVLDNENKFVIAVPDEKDAGIYTCSIPELNLSRQINVVGV